MCRQLFIIDMDRELEVVEFFILTDAAAQLSVSPFEPTPYLLKVHTKNDPVLPDSLAVLALPHHGTPPRRRPQQH